MRRSTFVLLSLLAAGLFEACAQVPPPARTTAWHPAEETGPREAAPPRAPTAVVSAPTIAPSRPPTQAKPYAARLVAGTSVEGRPLSLEVRGTGPDVVLVMATIHGNEPAGTPLARALLAHLDAHPDLLQGRRVLVMPDANPDGHAAGTRGNARGVDLNRNFEAPNRRDTSGHGDRALSEPEAEAVERVIRLHRPGRILSIHQPLSCVDWDGPAEALAKGVAARTDLPLKKLGTRPGSFGAWAEANGVALVTLELPPRVERLESAALWRRYGPAILAFTTASAPSGANGP